MLYMANINYNKLALEIFGPKAFADESEPIADNEQFTAAAEKALAKMEPAQRVAVEAVCLNGKERTAEIQNDYAPGMRYLKHPCRSRTLSPYLNKAENESL